MVDRTGRPAVKVGPTATGRPDRQSRPDRQNHCGRRGRNADSQSSGSCGPPAPPSGASAESRRRGPGCEFAPHPRSRPPARPAARPRAGVAGRGPPRGPRRPGGGPGRPDPPRPRPVGRASGSRGRCSRPGPPGQVAGPAAERPRPVPGPGPGLGPGDLADAAGDGPEPIQRAAPGRPPGAPAAPASCRRAGRSLPDSAFGTSRTTQIRGPVGVLGGASRVVQRHLALGRRAVRVRHPPLEPALEDPPGQPARAPVLRQVHQPQRASRTSTPPSGPSSASAGSPPRAATTRGSSSTSSAPSSPGSTPAVPHRGRLPGGHPADLQEGALVDQALLRAHQHPHRRRVQPEHRPEAGPAGPRRGRPRREPLLRRARPALRPVRLRLQHGQGDQRQPADPVRPRRLLQQLRRHRPGGTPVPGLRHGPPPVPGLPASTAPSRPAGSGSTTADRSGSPSRSTTAGRTYGQFYKNNEHWIGIGGYYDW